MSYLATLQEKRVALAHDVEFIRNQWKDNRGQIPPDVEEKLDRAVNDFETVEHQIAKIEKEEKVAAWANSAVERFPIAGASDAKGGKSVEVDNAVRQAFLRDLMSAGDAKNSAILRNAPSDQLQALKHAYQSDNMAGGGYFVTPIVMANEILTLMKDLVYIRSKAKTFALPTADTLGVPAIDTDPSDDDWTNELSTGNEETTAAAGRRELKCNPMAKLVKMSKTLIRKAPNFEEVFLDRLAYKAAITEEKAFLTGSGAMQPLGVFTASSSGISTGRDVTAASSSTFTADELINTLFTLKAQYRKNAEWILHRDVLKTARKLKDSNNNYIWSTGIGPGTGYQGLAPTLLGLPYNESEYAPNTFSTGKYMAIVGDFSFYWIADALDMQIQVLQELYAATNQMGYILRKETDGLPVLEEAFARLKLA